MPFSEVTHARWSAPPRDPRDRRGGLCLPSRWRSWWCCAPVGTRSRRPRPRNPRPASPRSGVPRSASRGQTTLGPASQPRSRRPLRKSSGPDGPPSSRSTISTQPTPVTRRRCGRGRPRPSDQPRRPRDRLARAPSAKAAKQGAPLSTISVPDPDGGIAKFRIQETSVMEPALAARHPDSGPTPASVSRTRRRPSDSTSPRWASTHPCARPPVLARGTSTRPSTSLAPPPTSATTAPRCRCPSGRSGRVSGRPPLRSNRRNSSPRAKRCGCGPTDWRSSRTGPSPGTTTTRTSWPRSSR